MSKRKVLLVGLAGVAAGAIAGLLLAPEKGSHLRKRLSKKSSHLKDVVMDKMEDGLTGLQDLKKNILSTMQHTAVEANNKASKIKHT